MRAATMRAFAPPLVACILSLTIASCGPSGAAVKAAKPPPWDTPGQARCGVTRSHETPLVVEWPDDARARLERAVTGELAGGLVAVRYESCNMQLLRGCTVRKAAYRYAPVTPKQSLIVIRNEDELYARLPVGAVGLEGKLKQAGQLTVDITMVGRFEADRQQFDRSALEGSCKEATHVVTGLTVGAFHFYTGASASASGGVSAVVVSGGGSTAVRHETITKDGSQEECKKSAAANTTPPFGCGAPIVVEVVNIDELRAAGSVTQPPGSEPRPYGAQTAPYGQQNVRPAGAPLNTHTTQSYGNETASGSSFFAKLTPAKVVAGVGGLIGVSAALAGGVGVIVKNGEIDAECEKASRSCSQKGLDAIDSHKTWALVGYTGLGVFAASALTFYLLPSRHDGGQATAFSVRPTTGGVALEFGRRF